MFFYILNKKNNIMAKARKIKPRRKNSDNKLKTTKMIAKNDEIINKIKNNLKLESK